MEGINLELMGMVWLRCEKRCVIVTRERSLRWACGKPDILGITAARYMIEIEIKRTVSDFRADMLKASRRNRDLYPSDYPKQFYYLMPTAIAAKVEKEIPEWAGLMTPGEPGVSDNVVVVKKKAPINKESKRLSMAECVRAATHQTNFILSLESACDYMRGVIAGKHTPYWEEHPQPGFIHFHI